MILSFRHAAQEEGESASAAGFSALELLTNIVDECAEHSKEPGLWQALEAQLVPFGLELLAHEDHADIWEYGVKIMCALTFEPPYPNCPQAWAALEKQVGTLS